MLTLTLSPHSLEKALCPWRYWQYRHACGTGRKPVGGSPGADAGTCVHAAWAVMNRHARDWPDARLDGVQFAASGNEQERVLAEQRAALPMLQRRDGTDDWCTLAYLTDALAQLRAVWVPWLASWRVLEVERRAVRRLGYYYSDELHPGWLTHLPVTPEEPDDMRPRVAIDLEFVRDVVLQHRETGEVWIVDLKTASRDDSTTRATYKVGDQGKAYLWAWNDEHPEMPAQGVQFWQLIMRKPVQKATARTKPTYEVMPGEAIRWPAAFINEWRESVLDRAQAILRRNPDDPRDWPLYGVAAGACANQWGACPYLRVCDLEPASRLTYLATDDFVPSAQGKRDAEPALTTIT
jgi:PAS domain-containing protein